MVVVIILESARTVAETLVFVCDASLVVFAAEGHTGIMGFELGDVEVERARGTDRPEVGYFFVYHSVRDIDPVDEFLADSSDILAQISYIGARSFGHGGIAARFEISRAVHLAQVELVAVQPQLYHPLDHPFDERDVGHGPGDSGSRPSVLTPAPPGRGVDPLHGGTVSLIPVLVVQQIPDAFVHPVDDGLNSALAEFCGSVLGAVVAGPDRADTAIGR